VGHRKKQKCSKMLSAFLSAVLCLQPMSPVIEDRVDLIEVNHFYDADAKHVFDQIIFYDWCDSTCRFQVRAWRMVKRSSQFPGRWGDSFRTSWVEGGETMRKVTAKAMRETWTQYDPELIERDVLPVSERKELGVRP
jgi:hypothetical protein